MRTAVLNLLGVPANDALFPAAKLTEWINQSLQEISTERDWPWLDAVETFTVSTATGTFSLDDLFRDTRSVTVDGRLARFISIAANDDWLSFDDQPTPWCYTINWDGGDPQLLIQPQLQSGSSILHRYVSDEDVLVNDTDTPAMPARWHYTIINKAAKYAAVSTNDVAGSKVFEDDFQGWLGKMNRAISRTHGPTRVRVRPGGGL